MGRTGSVPIISTICVNPVQEYHDVLPLPGPGPVVDHDFAAQDIVVLNKMIAGYNQPGRRRLVCKGIRLLHLHYDFHVNLSPFGWFATAATPFSDTNFQPWGAVPSASAMSIILFNARIIRFASLTARSNSLFSC